MRNPTIRPAAAADVPALLPMIRGLHEDERIPWDAPAVEAALRRLLAEPALGVVRLVEVGGRAAGYAIATLGYDLEFQGHDAYLTELWLEPWARGQGLAPALLATIEGRIRAAGAQALHLQVRPGNAAARALYERAGFALSPRLFMTKRLR